MAIFGKNVVFVVELDLSKVFEWRVLVPDDALGPYAGFKGCIDRRI